MAIEFVCSSCQSKHACADHLAGRQFKCGGCGKILEVPPTSQAGTAAAPRRVANGSPATDYGQERAGMPVWTQVTLLIFGTITLIVLLLLCLGVAPILWMTDGPQRHGVEMKEAEPWDEKQTPPVAAPAKKE